MLANEKLGDPKATIHGACISPFQSIHPSKDKRYLSLHGHEKIHPLASPLLGFSETSLALTCFALVLLFPRKMFVVALSNNKG
jgi:hypothetical protein